MCRIGPEPAAHSSATAPPFRFQVSGFKFPARSPARPEAAGQVDDENDQEDHAERATADNRPADVETATAEEKQQQEDKEYEVHAYLVHVPAPPVPAFRGRSNPTRCAGTAEKPEGRKPET